MFVLIGLSCGLAQPALGQLLIEDVGAVSARNAVIKERFTKLLLSASDQDWHAGWGLARNLGRPVTPVLWEMFASEGANVDRRLVLLIAAVLAGGPSEDERLFELLRQRDSMLRERITAGMLMALGPRRSRSVKNFWGLVVGPNQEPETLLGLAVRLASTRFPDAAKSAPMTLSDDPGIVAASAFAGLRMSAAQQKSLWRSERRHADLFLRGALLGEGWRFGIDGKAASLTDRAIDILSKQSGRLPSSRAAAILLLARTGSLDLAQDRPEWSLLQLVVSQPVSRPALNAWLPLVPLALVPNPRKLAVAYALYLPVAETLKSLRDWAADPVIGRDLAVALAFRLAAGDLSANPKSDPPALLLAAKRREVLSMDLPDLPEFRFVTWACGGEFISGSNCDDPELDQLAALIADGRVSRSVARTVFEKVLWRWGSHPGTGPWQQERLLVRDLMLVGSRQGGGLYQPQIPSVQRYVATGLDRSDTFFTIAVSMFEFLGRPVGPVPPEYRMR